MDKPEKPVPILGAINSSNTSCCIDFSRKCNINTDALVWVATWLCFAHNNLVNFTILPKVVWTSQRLQELAFIPYCWIQPDHVDQVLLDNSNSGQVLSTRRFDFAFFDFFLLCGSRLAMLEGQVCFEPSEEETN